MTTFWIIIKHFTISLSVIIPLLLVIAYFTLLERKIMGSIQRRIGPNIHGYYGALQPLIDGLKLTWKEILVPAKANFFVFLFSPMLMMSLSFSLWAILPLSFAFVSFDSKLSLITFFAISSLNIYNIILAGWSSNSKYSFLGAIRAMAQMFSYELILGFVILFMMITVGSLRIYDIVANQYYSGYLLWPLLPFAIIFFITLLMETNRSPFDLPEAEAELVSGYNVEYSSITFAMFFLGEYCNILAMSSMWSLLFWGGFIASYFGVNIFIIKTLFICFLFIFIRSMLPRYRVDQMIYIGWHVLLPISLGIFTLFISVAAFLNILPASSAFISNIKHFDPKTYDKLVEELTTPAKCPDVRTKFGWWKNVLDRIADSYYAAALVNHFTMTHDVLDLRIATVRDPSIYERFMGPLIVENHMDEESCAERGICSPTAMEVQSRIMAIQIERMKFDFAMALSEVLATADKPYEWSDKKYYDFLIPWKKFNNDFGYSTAGVFGSDFDDLMELTGNDQQLAEKIVNFEFGERDHSWMYHPWKVSEAHVYEHYAKHRMSLPPLVQQSPWFISPAKYKQLPEEVLSRLLLDVPLRSEIHSIKLRKFGIFVTLKHDKMVALSLFERACKDID